MDLSKCNTWRVTRFSCYTRRGRSVVITVAITVESDENSLFPYTSLL